MLEWFLALYLSLSTGAHEPLVRHIAAVEGQDPNFCVCIVSRESNWDARAVGDGGLAVGLWQIHMETWKFLRRKMGLSEDDLRHDPYESTVTAMWALSNGYERWWSAARLCRKEKLGQSSP